MIGMVLLCVLLIPSYAQQQTVNTLTELKRLASFHELPTYVNDTKLLQQSSYDTTGNNDDGFSGKYSFIRRNPDSSLVIFEAKGKGLINRIWTPTPTDDTLDFYLDKSKKPSFSIRFSDLFSGQVFPFVAPLTGNELGGYYSYVPIPYSNGCTIVSRGKKMQFYQIQYQSYPSTYPVEDFRLEKNTALENALHVIAQRWMQVDQVTKGSKAIEQDTLLAPGNTITLAAIKQGGRIVGLRLSPAEAFAGLHKQVDIRMTWDGEDKPAVYMPVADFFGYAFGKTSMQSLLLGTDNRGAYCYFPMPFAKEAKIELVYRVAEDRSNTEPIRIKSTIYVTDEPHDAAREGKFYAYWHPDRNTALGKPHVLLSGKGKGHYVGTLLQAQGLEPGMTLFFEGDDSTRIDGELRLHGTGSEDYFNGGWYALLDRWDRAMSLPLHGCLDYSLPFARTGGYRLFLSDKMPFNEEILHTIEHGPENNNKRGNYTSVALYYADHAITTDTEIQPTNALTDVYLPDTLMVYPQLIKYSISGNVIINGNVWESKNGGQIKIDLSELPAGTYQLFATMERAPDGAEVTVWQRQKQVSEAISFYAQKREHLAWEPICPIKLDKFKDAITLHFKKDDTRSKIYVNRLILVRQDH
ncbi:DUF2961 domain-containing protein [Olivibacter ginsenosidimutans]|uniref:DUF2961 domain-containing protein n=2 Tax=Olivibacter ginsenosidimutans TaxID=1176537 RepID=A0ABP9C1G8_9SPHI